MNAVTNKQSAIVHCASFDLRNIFYSVVKPRGLNPDLSQGGGGAVLKSEPEIPTPPAAWLQTHYVFLISIFFVFKNRAFANWYPMKTIDGGLEKPIIISYILRT